MANRLLSIQLGTGTAKLAEIAPNGKKVSVFSAYDVQLSEGLCDDGVILDVDSLAAELMQYISGYGIKCKKLVFSISSKRIASKEVVIPYVKEKQIQGIIQINAPEYFPVSNIEEYAINYSILEVVVSDTKQYRLSVTATPNELLKGYEDLAKAMKMSVEVIDHAGNAMLQILKSQAVSTEVDAILQIGRENTIINIMSGGILVMQRSVSYGLDSVVSAVMDSVRLNEEDALAFVEDNEIDRICQAYTDVNYVIQSMLTNISRIFEFYNTRSAEHLISSIKYVGDGTIINGIGTVIEQNLQIPTEEILWLYNVDVKGRSGLTPERATNYMSNIGAIIKPVGLKAVSTGADGEKKASDEKLPIWIIVLAVITAVLLVAASFALYTITKIKVETLEKQAEALAPMRGLEEQLNEISELTLVVDGFYQSTKGANDSIHRLITDLESIMPAQMSIDALSIDNGNVTISGGGIGKKSVARVVSELKNLKYVNNVYVDYVTEVDDLSGKYDTFTITFTLADISVIEIEEEETESPDDTDVEFFDEEAADNTNGGGGM